MEYITGIHALNLTCSLDTCGDWHQSAIQWSNPFFRNSKDSIFGQYGIEKDIKIPESDGLYNVANHIRALLDILELGKFTLAQGMRDDYICNDKYSLEIFDQVIKLSTAPLWPKIDRFMEKEYLMAWVRYRREYTHERLA